MRSTDGLDAAGVEGPSGRGLLVIGLGVTGESVARHALAGATPPGSSTPIERVVVVDDDPERSGFAARADAARAMGAEVAGAPDVRGLDDLVASSALVVPSPGVPPGHPVFELAARRGVPVLSEVELGAAAGRALGRRLVAVTGTNGKTTVVTLITQMLLEGGVRAASAGNIGRPLLDAVHDDLDVVVAEVSSFQLAYTRDFRPSVAVLLNLAPDHGDWHPSFDDYIHAKCQIFENQRGDDVLVFNADDPLVVQAVVAAPALRRPCSLDPASAGGGWSVVEGTLVTETGAEVLAVTGLGRAAPHDVSNALHAAAAAHAAGAPLGAIASVLGTFSGLPHRLERVEEAGGVLFYDDSKATNPHATLHALEAFRSVVLIAGGRNKGLDLGVLAAQCPRLRAVVAIGEAAAEVESSLSAGTRVVHAASMREAVGAAAALAVPGDVVLLSPACASFDWYTSYAARGDDFAFEVRRLIVEGELAPGPEVRSS